MQVPLQCGFYLTSNSDTYLESMSIIRQKKSYSSYILTPEIEEAIKQLSEGTDVYGKLARSLAPEIFGCEDIKKALLLLMISGVTRQMHDGMKIRGKSSFET